MLLYCDVLHDRVLFDMMIARYRMKLDSCDGCPIASSSQYRAFPIAVPPEQGASQDCASPYMHMNRHDM